MSAPPGDETTDYDEAMPGAQTELAPSSDETAANTAWALDDGPKWRPPFWTSGRITELAATVAVLAAITAAGLAGYHVRDRPDMVGATASTSTVATLPITTAASASPAPERKGWGLPAPRLTKTVAAPPKTVTVQAPTPPQPVYVPTIDMTAFDSQFIRNMLAQGWEIWNSAQSADTARLACSMLTNGATFDYVASFLATRSQASMQEGRVFTSTAMRAYPQCSQG